MGAGAIRQGFSEAGFPHWNFHWPERPWTPARPPAAWATGTSALPARFPETPRFPCRGPKGKKPKPWGCSLGQGG